ncbi:hypothetical protein, partial [Acetobacter senegalensis]|uniref:hypothetical protein n=1 Tax=Acetobacter senegalensis TaxID=446692 RepID=UPI001B80AB71
MSVPAPIFRNGWNKKATRPQQTHDKRKGRSQQVPPFLFMRFCGIFLKKYGAIKGYLKALTCQPANLPTCQPA